MALVIRAVFAFHFPSILTFSLLFFRRASKTMAEDCAERPTTPSFSWFTIPPPLPPPLPPPREDVVPIPVLQRSISAWLTSGVIPALFATMPANPLFPRFFLAWFFPMQC